MRDEFQPLFDNLDTASTHLPVANQQMVEATQQVVVAANEVAAANTAIHHAIKAARAAQAEHEDIRETVNRLEQLLIARGQELRALREQIEKQHGP